MPAHKSFHPMQRFLDFAVLSGVASADKTLSAGTEGATRHNRHAFFF
jgi:hypothetical protein